MAEVEDEAQQADRQAQAELQEQLHKLNLQVPLRVPGRAAAEKKKRVSAPPPHTHTNRDPTGLETQTESTQTKTETEAEKTETPAHKEKPHDQQHECFSADGCKRLASSSRSSSPPSTLPLRQPMPLSILSVPLVVMEHKQLPSSIQVRERVRASAHNQLNLT